MQMNPDLQADYDEAKKYLKEFVENSGLDPIAIDAALIMLLAHACTDKNELNAIIYSLTSCSFALWEAKK